jgi:hypothetical protein
MGALSAIMGMLPIHLVSAGWILDPLFTSNNRAGSDTSLVLHNDSLDFDT